MWRVLDSVYSISLSHYKYSVLNNIPIVYIPCRPDLHIHYIKSQQFRKMLMSMYSPLHRSLPSALVYLIYNYL